MSEEASGFISNSNASGKTVLVSLLEHTRPLSIPVDGDLKQHVKNLFSDVIQAHAVADFFLQLKDENWGVFVDLLNQQIPDRAILRAQVIEQVMGAVMCVLYYKLYVVMYDLPRARVNVRQKDVCMLLRA